MAPKKTKRGTKKSRALPSKRSAPTAAARAPSRRPAKKKTGRAAAAKPVAKKTPVGKLRAKKTAAKKASAKKAPAKKTATKVARRSSPKPAVVPTKGIKLKRPLAKAPAPKKTRAPLRRRDAVGHLDPKYAADLLRRSGQTEEPRAFLDSPRSPHDDLAESLGEQFVRAATSGENEGEEVLDQIVPEEVGGPFVGSTAGQEFADGTDASNPKSAKREPFPTT